MLYMNCHCMIQKLEVWCAISVEDTWAHVFSQNNKP
jgi:hypothetical protein